MAHWRLARPLLKPSRVSEWRWAPVAGSKVWCPSGRRFLGTVITETLNFYALHAQYVVYRNDSNCGASSEFVSSSNSSWQILTAHAQSFRRARDLAFCLKIPLDSQLVWASSGGSGETARMRRLAWTFAARIGDKNENRLTPPNFVFRERIWIDFYWVSWFVFEIKHCRYYCLNDPRTLTQALSCIKGCLGSHKIRNDLTLSPPNWYSKPQNSPPYHKTRAYDRLNTYLTSIIDIRQLCRFWIGLV